MNRGLRQKLVAAWLVQPEDIRSPPASDAKIAAFEKRFGPIPSIFRWFLQECGGGAIGSEWVDDIDALTATHEKFAIESALPAGWRLKDVFVIGGDGEGNPFGIQAGSGKVLVEDHDFGGVHEMAPSFAALLSRGLLEKA